MVNANVNKASVKNDNRFYGTGRRKTATARCWIKPAGSGKFSVNTKDPDSYFGRRVLVTDLIQPLEVCGLLGKVDIYCTVKGSGLSGQAGAVRHALARALVEFDSENFHKILRQKGFLTRDSREVERKKYGRKKARKSFQFSKR